MVSQPFCKFAMVGSPLNGEPTIQNVQNGWLHYYGSWEFSKNKNYLKLYTNDGVNYQPFKIIGLYIPIIFGYANNDQHIHTHMIILDSFTDFESSFGHEYSNELNALDNPEIIQKMILEQD